MPLLYNYDSITGNNVTFLTLPSFERTSSSTTVQGCTYSSARNTNMTSYAFLKVDNEIFKIMNNTTAGSSQVGYMFSLPPFIFPHRVSTGFFSCVMQIGEEYFESPVSKLFNTPRKMFS